MRRAVATTVAGMMIAGSAVAGCTGSTPGRSMHSDATSTSTGAASPARPNIVFVLTDDLSKNLVPYMPHVQALGRRGMTFTNYTVDDSLCCPSRASIFTGNYPHTTKIVVNSGKHGGFTEFHNRGEEQHTFAITLHDAGYRTGFMGKYLNRYDATYPVPPVLRDWTPPQATWVPPGWDEWDGVGFGYPQYDYNLNHNHQIIHHGHRPKDYLNSVLQHYGTQFIGDSVQRKQPFFLEVSSYTPHTPNTAAPRDVNSFPDLKAPRGPAFNRVPVNAPSWYRSRRAFRPQFIAALDLRFRQRVEAVQSVDRMIGALEKKLRRTGQLANTVFVFSSDNGYHIGEHRLYPGKLTAYDTDVNVPLVVAGPGIAPGSTNGDLVQNVDLAPTFDELAGTKAPASVEGKSIVALLHGQRPGWRSLALIEHSGPDLTPSDPDVQTIAEGNPPSYMAIRSTQFTYVRYYNGETEYYDRVKDPYELDNVAVRLTPARRAQLQSWLTALHKCSGGAQCWQAGRPGGL